MNQPCRNKSNDCSCDPNPVTNFSSEAADPGGFLAVNWVQPKTIFSNPDTAIGPGTPPGYCEGQLTLAQAMLCAGNDNFNWSTGRLDPVGSAFGNQVAQCTVLCPDGLPFTYQVGANMVIRQTQEEADRIAIAMACQYAIEKRVCMSDISSSGACLAQSYTGLITASAMTPVIFSLVSGALPPGTSLVPVGTNGVNVTGVPNTAGTYTFALRAIDANANYMQKTYVVRVMSITPTLLPDGTDGNAYFQQLTATGGSGAVTFALEGGALPAGLTMDGTGLIQGTPTAQGDFTFTVGFTDSAGLHCLRDYELHVGAGECADWSTAVWAVGLQSGPDITLFTFSGGTVETKIDTTGGADSFIRDFVAHLNYTGPGCNCKAVITVDRTAGVESGNTGFQVLQDGVIRMSWRTADYALVDSTTVPFTLIAGVNSVIEIRGYPNFASSWFTWCNGNIPGQHSYHKMIISNV